MISPKLKGMPSNCKISETTYKEKLILTGDTLKGSIDPMDSRRVSEILEV